MIRVKVFCNWLEFHLQHKLIERIHDQFVTPENYDPEIIFTIDDDYDFFVTFNYVPKNVKTDKKYILGFIQEPPLNKEFDINMGKFCNKVYTCANRKYYSKENNYISAPSFMFYHLLGKAQEYLKNENFFKPRKLSICVSSKKGGYLYDYRVELVNKILASNLDCDIYGEGWNIVDSRYKGNPANKAKTLLPYEYSIAIENSLYDGYVSEKLFDCFLCNTVPIYFGTNTADIIYNPESFMRLPYTNDFEKMVDWLKDLTKTPFGTNLKYKEAVLESKDRFFKKYNMYDLIKNFIRENSG